MCCFILGVENRAGAHAKAQRCCTNLTKQVVGSNVSCNICGCCMKHLSQHVATEWSNARNNAAICCARRNLAIVWPGFNNTNATYNANIIYNFLIPFHHLLIYNTCSALTNITLLYYFGKALAYSNI